MKFQSFGSVNGDFIVCMYMYLYAWVRLTHTYMCIHVHVFNKWTSCKSNRTRLSLVVNQFSHLVKVHTCRRVMPLPTRRCMDSIMKEGGSRIWENFEYSLSFIHHPPSLLHFCWHCSLIVTLPHTWFFLPLSSHLCPFHPLSTLLYPHSSFAFSWIYSFRSALTESPMWPPCTCAYSSSPLAFLLHPLPLHVPCTTLPFHL